MALLDTTVLIDLARPARNTLHHRAANSVRRLLHEGEMLFTSRINEAEFRVGPEMSADRPGEIVRVERILAAMVILEFNEQAARHYAVIKATTLRRGLPVGDCDAMIASVAIAHGQMLLTRNARHFARIGGLSTQSY